MVAISDGDGSPFVHCCCRKAESIRSCWCCGSDDCVAGVPLPDGVVVGVMVRVSIVTASTSTTAFKTLFCVVLLSFAISIRRLAAAAASYKALVRFRFFDLPMVSRWLVLNGLYVARDLPSIGGGDGFCGDLNSSKNLMETTVLCRLLFVCPSHQIYLGETKSTVGGNRTPDLSCVKAAS